MQKRFYLCILLLFLSSCSQPASLPPATEPLGPTALVPLVTRVPTPVPQSYHPPPTWPHLPPATYTPTAGPTSWPPPPPTPVPTPTPTSGPSPTPTPTYPPYTDNPFTVLFMRDGNLWLAEVEGNEERQLTSEPPGWWVESYAIAPDCRRVAYVSYYNDSITIDALVKQVDFADGTVSLLFGQDDPYVEQRINWLDNTHVAFDVQFLASGREDGSNPGDKRGRSTVVDLETGLREYLPEQTILVSQSPDRRYWITTGFGYAPGPYSLQDRQTGEVWPLAVDSNSVDFCGWSPDGRQLLLCGFIYPDVEDAWLVLVDLPSRQETKIDPPDRLLLWAHWSPDGESIAYVQCAGREESPPNALQGCALGLMDRNGGDQRLIAPLPADLLFVLDGWTPDGQRLVLYEPNADAFWSIRTDGTDLRPIVLNMQPSVGAQVLCQP